MLKLRTSLANHSLDTVELQVCEHSDGAFQKEPPERYFVNGFLSSELNENQTEGGLIPNTTFPLIVEQRDWFSQRSGFEPRATA